MRTKMYAPLLSKACRTKWQTFRTVVIEYSWNFSQMFLFFGKANFGTRCCVLEQTEFCLCPFSRFECEFFVWVKRPSIACFCHGFVKWIKWVTQTKNISGLSVIRIQCTATYKWRAFYDLPRSALLVGRECNGVSHSHSIPLWSGSHVFRLKLSPRCVKRFVPDFSSSLKQ